jgi:hypothetical protein
METLPQFTRDENDEKDVDVTENHQNYIHAYTNRFFSPYGNQIGVFLKSPHSILSPGKNNVISRKP